MFRKSYLYLILAAAISLTAQMTAYSQFAPVNGTVVLEKDGKTVPVAGALIEVYRVDINAGFKSTKTNNKGEFNYVGMPYGSYVFAVSAANCEPTLFPVRAGQEKLVITMSPGDGRKFTEAEARKGAENALKPGEKDSGPSEEDKKAQEELNKKNAEIMAKNEKIKNADAIAIRSATEGKAALDAKNFDLAITKYSEGVAAVPDFVGATPILLAGKIEALRGKGYEAYKQGATSSDAEMKTAKYHEANHSYDEALEAFQQAIAVIKAATPAAEPAEQKKRETITLGLYSSATEIHRLKAITGVDSSKITEASALYSEYIAMLVDPAKKIDAQMSLGEIMRRTGDFEKAVEAYRQVLTLKPDHAEATGWLGLSLFGQGSSVVPEDKQKEQEGLNFMQKYIDMSPVSPTDSVQVKELKGSIKDALEYLKTEKMVPQKVPSAPKKKN